MRLKLSLRRIKKEKVREKFCFVVEKNYLGTQSKRTGMPARGPYLVLPTRKGSLINLTPAQANSVLNDEEKWMSISVFEASEFISPLTQGGISLCQFCGLSDFKSILTLHNCFHGLRSTATSVSNSGKTTISSTYEKGKLSLNLQKFIEIASCIHPDCMVCPHEAIQLCESAERKRKATAVRNSKWKEEITDAMASVDVTNRPKNVFFSDTNALSPSGAECNMIFISSLPGNENLEEFDANLSDITQHFSLSHLSSPSSKEDAGNSVFMVSVNSIAHFFIALKYSITFIESSLPWSLAEKGIAFVVPEKFLKYSEGRVSSQEIESIDFLSSDFSFLIDLNDHKYQLDTTSIQCDCKCYTCTRHTKAYLHHLLTVQEMNSEILLSLHNLSTFVVITRKFRNSSAEEREMLSRMIFSFF